MDDQAKKTALRMIPYGLYVLMAESGERVAASTINWAMQVSFAPPLVALGVKTDSGIHALIQESGKFSLNVLGKDQGELAFTYFKPQERDGETIGGQAFNRSPAGVPVLANAPAWIEGKLRETVDLGDHSVFVCEVTEAHVSKQPAGRPDEATLWLKDLGDRLFYGG
jgi:flavin reductase (DIM6/NTAB) family NADH-FMN oxidoreductase RutF